MKFAESIGTISVEEAKQKLNDPNVQFIDVRGKEAFERNGIENAMHLERGLLEFYLAVTEVPWKMTTLKITPIKSTSCTANLEAKPLSQQKRCRTWA